MMMEPKIDQSIWLYHDPRQETADNPVLTLCRDIITAWGGSDVHMVGPDNIAEYLPDLPFALDSIPTNEANPTDFSPVTGYVEAKLLQRYGGIWIDPQSIYLKSPKAQLQEVLAKKDFGLVKRDSPTGTVFFSSLMAARAQSPFINELVQRLEAYIEEGKPVKWWKLCRTILTPVAEAHKSSGRHIDELQVQPVKTNNKAAFNNIASDDMYPTVLNHITEETVAVHLFLNTLNTNAHQSAYTLMEGPTLLASFFRFACRNLDISGFTGLSETEMQFSRMHLMNFRNHLRLSYVTIPEKKIFYANVSKCACSTIKEILYRIAHYPEHYPEGVSPHSSRWNKFLDALNTMTPDEQYGFITAPDTYKFTFVRNPFGRLLSAYYQKLLFLDPSPYDDNIGARRNWLAECATVQSKRRPLFEQREKPTFEDFIHHVCETEPFAMNRHWVPMADAAHIGRIEYDFIGKLENFTEDMTHVLRTIGAPEDVTIPKRNASKRKLKPEDYYTPELERLVAKTFARDFEAFGYPDRIGKTLHAVPGTQTELFATEDRLDYQLEQQKINAFDINKLRMTLGRNTRNLESRIDDVDGTIAAQNDKFKDLSGECGTRHAASLRAIQDAGAQADTRVQKVKQQFSKVTNGLAKDIRACAAELQDVAKAVQDGQKTLNRKINRQAKAAAQTTEQTAKQLSATKEKQQAMAKELAACRKTLDKEMERRRTAEEHADQLQLSVGSLEAEVRFLKQGLALRALTDFERAANTRAGKVGRPLSRKKEIAILCESSTMDPAWYWTQMPSAEKSGSGPEKHYAQSGAARGYAPVPYFDTAAYVAQHPDLCRTGLNPFVHFLLEQEKEGIPIAPYPLSQPMAGESETGLWVVQAHSLIVPQGPSPYDLALFFDPATQLLRVLYAKLAADDAVTVTYGDADIPLLHAGDLTETVGVAGWSCTRCAIDPAQILTVAVGDRLRTFKLRPTGAHTAMIDSKKSVYSGIPDQETGRILFG